MLTASVGFFLNVFFNHYFYFYFFRGIVLVNKKGSLLSSWNCVARFLRTHLFEVTAPFYMLNINY